MITGNSNSQKKMDVTVPMILLGFAVICFLTSFVLSSLSAGSKKDKMVPQIGGEIGPIKIERPNTIYEFSVRQDLIYGSWSNVSIDVLNENKKLLFTFNKEFWAESGYDEGYWYEKDNKMATKVNFKKRGIYYLKVNSEASANVRSGISVTMHKKRGSHLPHLVVGIIAGIIGLVWYVIIMRRAEQSYMKFN